MQGERVLEAIGSKGWRAADLCRELRAKGYSVTEQAIGKWFKGSTKNIQSEYLFAIEDLTGYRARWMSEGKLPKKVDLFSSHLCFMFSGLSPILKDQLLDFAHHLYIKEHPDDKRANPFPNKPSEVKQ